MRSEKIARAVPPCAVVGMLLAAGLPAALATDPATAATTTTAATAATVASPLRVSTAPAAVTDSAGQTWRARTGFTGGRYAQSYDASMQIAGTSDQALYRHELVGMSRYAAAVPAGTYRVTLKMREFWWTKAGQRVFDVDAEGRRALSGVDIVKAVGKDRAYDRSFDTTVTDGTLDLGFSATADVALVSALQITPLSSTGTTPATSSTYRMSVFPTATKAADGTTYEARTGFTGGWYTDSVIARGTDIKGTGEDVLYRPEYVAPSAWRRAVPNGTYDVTLKMREGYFTAAGKRVFHVDAEGKRVLTGIDIVKAVGPRTAYDRTVRVGVTDGQLDLGFSAAVDNAVVSAIVVTPVSSSTPAPTPTPTTTPKPTTPTPTTTTPTTPSAPAPQGVSGTWRVAMADEFSGTSLNRSVWTAHRGLEPYTYGHPFNAALDNYAFDPSRATVKDGSLRLSWDKTPITVQNSSAPYTTTYPYTAGIAHTGKGFAFTHGFVEARIWVPDTPGLWPAFWMLPTPVDKDWPPEIDIAEIIPDDTPDGLYKPHFNYHYKDAAGNHQQSNWKWYGDAGKSYAGSWHTYGLLWEKGKLQAFIDGKPGPSYASSSVTNSPMYVVLSSGVRKGYSPPAGSMLVDYLRVWQRG